MLSIVHSKRRNFANHAECCYAECRNIYKMMPDTDEMMPEQYKAILL